MKNREVINELIEILDENNLSDLEYEDSNFKIKFKRNLTDVSVVSAPVAKMAEVETVTEEKVVCKEEILSPIVGTYYESPAPGKKPFVSVGDSVVEGQVVCIVEAMKVMMEINAPCSGVISEILINDSDGVEYNQVLMRIK